MQPYRSMSLGHLALLATLAIASTGAALPQEANAPEVIHAESA
jgi:hypothetical protein